MRRCVAPNVTRFDTANAGLDLGEHAFGSSRESGDRKGVGISFLGLIRRAQDHRLTNVVDGALRQRGSTRSRAACVGVGVRTRHSGSGATASLRGAIPDRRRRPPNRRGAVRRVRTTRGRLQYPFADRSCIRHHDFPTQRSQAVLRAVGARSVVVTSECSCSDVPTNA